MFIPVGTLLWKFSKIVFQVENNKKDLNNLSQKLSRRVDKIDERFIMQILYPLRSGGTDAAVP
jgi:hypothetical protein